MVKKKVDKPKSKEPQDHIDAKIKVVAAMNLLGYDAFLEVQLYDVRQRDYYYDKKDHRIQLDKNIYCIEARDVLTGKNILEEYPKLNEDINNNYLKRNDVFCIHREDQSLVIIEVQDILDSIHGKPRVMNRDLNSVLRIMMMYPKAILIQIGKGWIKETGIEDIKGHLEWCSYTASNPLYEIAQAALANRDREQ